MDERKENGLGREPYCLSVTVVVVMKSKADREHIPWDIRSILFSWFSILNFEAFY